MVTTRRSVAVRGRGEPASAAANRAFASRRRAVLGLAVPAMFELVVNARTAKALGFALPRSLLLRRRGDPVTDRSRFVLAARVRGDPVTVALARLGRVPLRDVVGQEGRMRRFQAVVAATPAPSFARNACARAGESVD